MLDSRKTLNTSVSFLILSTLMACGASEPENNASKTADKPYISDGLLPYAERPINDDIIYFLLPDRFENGAPANDTGFIAGGVADHGFDPTRKGFFHGGDLQGVTKQLDYIQSLGATAIWITPIYKNKPVQGEGDLMSSGYHGYWITDFMSVDPHLGGNIALKDLVDAAHGRNMKVILDIVTNHTADVIKYRECHDRDYNGPDKQVDGNCAYRSKEDYPYTQYKAQGDVPVNNGFQGDGPKYQTEKNFTKLSRSDYAYTPYIPVGEESAKNPAWLNDISLYHNRGETTFEGENSLYGDFFGLDDIFTEHPKVVAGFTDIFKRWISDYKIDGFRVDTTRHVNDAFWQKFVPSLLEHAKAEGIPNFYIFGEVYDFEPKSLSRFTREVGLPAVLDFGFAGSAIDVIAKGAATNKLADIFASDPLYGTDGAVARQLPTFISNHDMGRMAYMMKEAMTGISDDEALNRLKLANALLFFARGVPVLYYGDEQGFVGDGGDQAAREDMFESVVESYNDNDLIATTDSTADDNFDSHHPLFQEISKLATAYHQNPALRHGIQKVIKSEDKAGVFAFERYVSKTQERIIVAINTDPLAPRAIEAPAKLSSIIGNCNVASVGNELVIAPLDYAVCKISE
jgi:glycosidase